MRYDRVPFRQVWPIHADGGLPMKLEDMTGAIVQAFEWQRRRSPGKDLRVVTIARRGRDLLVDVREA